MALFLINYKLKEQKRAEENNGCNKQFRKIDENA